MRAFAFALYRDLQIIFEFTPSSGCVSLGELSHILTCGRSSDDRTTRLADFRISHQSAASFLRADFPDFVGLIGSYLVRSAVFTVWEEKQAVLVSRQVFLVGVSAW